MKRILVACDGSYHCARALDVACGLARAHDASLFIVSVREAGGPTPELMKMAQVEHTARAEDHAGGPNLARVPSWVSDAVDAVRRSDQTTNISDQLASQLLERARLEARGHGVSDITLLERSGDAADEILHCVQEIDADVVVVGSRGLGPIKSALLGSVSHAVARGVPDGCTCVTATGGGPHP